MQMQHTKNLNPQRFVLGTTLSKPNRSIDFLTIETGLLNCFTHRADDMELIQVGQTQTDI